MAIVHTSMYEAGGSYMPPHPAGNYTMLAVLGKLYHKSKALPSHLRKVDRETPSYP